jgi:hypothetical protein
MQYPPPLRSPVVLSTFYSVEEAELVCAQLVGSGIAARVEGQHAVGVLPTHAIALGGVRVVVDAAGLEEAQELLSSLRGDGTGSEADAPTDEGVRSRDDTDFRMRQAAFSAFLGLCMCPVVGTLYSCILLARYSDLPRSSRGTLHRRMAIGFDAIALGVLIVWWIKVGPL